MKLFSTVVFVICALFLVGTAMHVYQQLPERIASHFDGSGSPNGWMNKSSFTSSMLAVGLGIPALVIVIMYSIRFLPARFLNVPNPDHWRDPNNYRKACDFLFVSSLWFGSAYMIWHAFLSRMVVAANQSSPPHLDSVKAMLVTGLLLVFMFVWVLVLLLRFLKTDDVGR